MVTEQKLIFNILPVPVLEWRILSQLENKKAQPVLLGGLSNAFDSGM